MTFRVWRPAQQTRVIKIIRTTHLASLSSNLCFMLLERSRTLLPH